ncbi:MAG: radical SAM protein [Candidatus Omnitrophota bacterium]
MPPRYLKAYKNGKLQRIADQLYNLLETCSICPRNCRVNRLKKEIGFCRTGLKPKVFNFMPHHGEEPPISGVKGSGTIFFSHCNMACVYCQNFKFSQKEEGREVDFNELAGFMLKLQESGCHNLNLVTPTHVLPQILKALLIAIPKGLKLPIVYNTSGYELKSIIELLNGIVDIYLADMRYADNTIAKQYSNALGYPQYNQEALKEMFRQVGIAEFDKSSIITKGIIIRHLVLPNKLSGTEKIMEFIAKELSENTYISLMSQYTPYYKASVHHMINRRISAREYAEAQNIMQKYKLYNGWMQESQGLEKLAGVNIKRNI